jgi:YfiH family protein
MIVYNQKLKIFCSTLINDACYFSGFGTRELGDGRNFRNIFQFLHQNEINYKKLVILDQIHSVNIEFFDFNGDKNLKKIEDTDGIITNKRNIVLTVRTADCLPVIFIEKKKKLIGISHQGWRGSLKKMVVKMINLIVKSGGKKENILVGIGPGVGACCYDVGDDRYYQFLEEFDGYSDKIFQERRGKRYLNLMLFNYLLLREYGIKKENIDFFPFCTCCDKERFFSFRRDRKEDYGEMFNFVVRLE